MSSLPERLRRAVRTPEAAALAAGAALPLAFAPVGWYLLAVLAPALLFRLWRGMEVRRAARLGWLFGLGQFGVGVSWVFVAIHDFGQSNAVVAAVLTAVLVAVLGLYPALVGALAARFGRGRGEAAALLGLYPAVWVLVEWLRGWFLTGFPWLDLGYSQTDGPLAAVAPVAGVLGIGWLLAFTAGALAYLSVAGRRAWPVGLAVAALWFGGVLLQRVEWGEGAGAPLRVAVVQANVPQETKWDPDHLIEGIERQLEMSRPYFGSTDLVVWPENALTLFYHQLREVFLKPLSAEIREAGTDMLLGIPVLAADGRRYYTTMMSLGRHEGFFRKRHLVPFGEYVPFEQALRGLIGFFDLPMSEFIPGPAGQRPLRVAGQRAAVSVCYEDAFGHEVRKAAPQATLLVNGSNNAWYGDSLAPHQHLQISRMRAIETARPLVRSTTNGISALVDHRGTILGRSPQFEGYVLTGTVQPRSGTTPYVRWGDWPVLGLAFAVVGVLAWRGRGRVGVVERA